MGAKAKKKVPCPVCGALTLDALGQYDICAVCHWEDEEFAVDPLDSESMANHGLTVRVARAIWATTRQRLRGVCEFPTEGVQFDEEALQHIALSLEIVKPMADTLEAVGQRYKAIRARFSAHPEEEAELWDERFSTEVLFSKALAGRIAATGELPDRGWLHEIEMAGLETEPELS